MNREASSSKVAVEADERATEKKPYISPSLEKRERLDEVTEGRSDNVSGLT
jgi:hypothetical protein